jgi:hypothetical protein
MKVEYDYVGVEIVKNHVESFKNFQHKVKQSTFITNDRPNDLTDLISKLQVKTKSS